VTLIDSIKDYRKEHDFHIELFKVNSSYESNKNGAQTDRVRFRHKTVVDM
jgi:hypothetical protein